jgi:hypothetical protein
VKKIDIHFAWILMLAGLTAFLWITVVDAKEARTVRLSDKKLAPIYVRAGRSTVLNFPVKPTKVILGNTGAFSVQYIENDLAISPLSVGASSNLFVYLLGRRFGFDLIPRQNADEVVIVRDILDKPVQVRIRNE